MLTNTFRCFARSAALFESSGKVRSFAVIHVRLVSNNDGKKRPFANLFSEFQRKAEDKNNLDAFEVFNDRFGGNLDDLKKINGFQLFGMQEKFKVNQAQLKKEMIKLQRILHPDKFINSGKRKQDLSNQLSALVNDFYSTLDHPYKRAKYLLSLISNKTSSEIEENLDSLQMDESFLARMMEVRELIEDSHLKRETLEKLRYEIDSELHQLTLELDTDFNAKDMDSILKKLGKLKFLANCQKSLEDKPGFS